MQLAAQEKRLQNVKKLSILKPNYIDLRVVNCLDDPDYPILFIFLL